VDFQAKLLEAALLFLRLTGELAVLFLVISFLVGLLREYVLKGRIERALSKARAPLSNILGAGFGAMTPFCSCGSIPILVGLLNAGAPFGASMSFLVASPLLNPIIISLLITFIGVKVAVAYAVFTFTAAVLTGIVWERLGFSRFMKRVRVVGGGADGAPVAMAEGLSWWQANRPRIAEAAAFSLRLFRQMAPFVLIGAAIGSVIHGFLPEEFIVRVAGPENPAAVPVAAVIGVPMYIRASTMIPIGAALMEKGITVGAVTALVIGGSGASIPSLAMLAAIFKRGLLVVFVVTILTVAVITGFAFNVLLA